MIKIDSVYKKYPKSEKYSCEDISLEVKKNEIFGFMGTNGAGKTTLIKILCSLIKPTKGSVFIDGEKLTDKIAQEKISVVLEGARNLYNFLTVEDNLKYFELLNKTKKSNSYTTDELLKMFDLYEKKKVEVKKLSRGMQQKVAIMVAILKNPEYIILDEPTLGLDIESRYTMKEFLKGLCTKHDKTIIVCSHDADFIGEICENVAIFKDGKIINYNKFDQVDKVDDTYTFVVENYEGFSRDMKDINFELITEVDIYKFKSKEIEKVLKAIPSKYILNLEKNRRSMEEIYLKTVKEVNEDAI